MSAPDQRRRWPVWKLALLLYPFVTAAVAIDLFMLGLLGPVFGVSPLAPLVAVWISLPLGVFAALVAGRWVRRLIDQADQPP